MTQFTWKKDVEITAADIPESTTEIIFYDGFNQPIGPNVLPDSLEIIIFGDGFNQPIGPNVLPDSLKIVIFGDIFNQPIGPNVLPEYLKTIEFGDEFNQPIYQNVLPEYLETIIFGWNYNQPIGPNVLPDCLKSISYERDYNQPMTALYHLNHIECICIFSENLVEINGRLLPPSLKYLHTDNACVLESLNSESQRMWFHVIHIDISIMPDITYPILQWMPYICDGDYEVIGTETINGLVYEKIINPVHYQPRSNAKSARK